MPKVTQPGNGRGEAIMPASLTQSPPFHCAKLHVWQVRGDPCVCLELLEEKEGSQDPLPKLCMLPAPHPQPVGISDSLQETVQVQDVPGLRSAVDGGQEGKGMRDRAGGGGGGHAAAPPANERRAENHR